MTDLVDFKNDLAGFVAALYLQIDLTDLSTPLRPFVTQFLECSYSAFIARAARLDSLPDPFFFLFELLIKQFVLSFPGLQLLLS